MSVSKEEINKLKHVFASEENGLPSHAIHLLISFTSTHMSEIGFSNHTATETD
jgi:hypothetical protein